MDSYCLPSAIRLRRAPTDDAVGAKASVTATRGRYRIRNAFHAGRPFHVRYRLVDVVDLNHVRALPCPHRVMTPMLVRASRCTPSPFYHLGDSPYLPPWRELPAS